MKILFQKIFLSITLVSITFFALAQDVQKLPALNSHVSDYTSTLTSSEISILEKYLTEFENKKGSQVVVLIVPTTKPEEIEEYGIRLAEKWKIGRKNVDDAVILLIAKDDRKLRIEVGYGLEGAIPDIYAKRIIENKITPAFRQGQFYEGVKNGLMALVSLIEGEELPAVTSNTSSSNTLKSSGASFFVIFLIIGGFIAKSLIKNNKVKGVLVASAALVLGFISSSIVIGIMSLAIISIFFFMPSGSGRSGGRYYGGGGFSGGGFSGGGFSGGGGSFGGGGASGGW